MTDLEEQKTPPTNNIELPKVGIVGAGISGLSSKQMHSEYNFLQFFNNYFRIVAAIALKNLGVDVSVLEQSTST